MCVCVCVRACVRACVCARARERERERGGDRETDRQIDRETESVRLLHIGMFETVWMCTLFDSGLLHWQVFISMYITGSYMFVMYCSVL